MRKLGIAYVVTFIIYTLMNAAYAYSAVTPDSKLVWDEIQDATGYRMYYSLDANFTEENSLEVGVVSREVALAQMPLEPGKVYQFAVKAISEYRESAYSNVIMVKIPYPPLPTPVIRLVE